MELLAVTNGLIQIGVMVATARQVRAQNTRLRLYWVSGAALMCSVAGLLASAAPALPELSGVAMWVIYAAIGAAVVGAVAAVLRRPGSMRFVWRQGKYQRYKSYRRI